MASDNVERFMEVKDTYEQLEEFMRTLTRFYDQNYLSDVTIEIIDNDEGSTFGRSFHVHKIILASQSLYFRSIFTDSSISFAKVIYDDYDSMVDCINYIYTSKVILTNKNARRILRAACYLQISKLTQVCGRYIVSNLDTTNCLSDRDTFLMNELTDFFTIVENFMKMNFKQISESEEFKGCTFEYIEQLIEMDDIHASEKEIYDIVYKWINVDLENRKQYLAILFLKLKLPLMSMDDLLNISKDELINEDPVARCFIDQVLLYKVDQKGYDKLPDDDKLPKEGNFEPRVKTELTSESPLKIDDINESNWSAGTKMIMTISGIGDKNLAVDSVKVSSTGHTGSWLPVKDVQNKRYLHAAVLCRGCVYIIGGQDNKGNVLTSVEKYDPENNTWTDCKPLPTAGANFSAVAVDGSIYVIGGSYDKKTLKKVIKLDTHAEKWVDVSNLNEARAGHAAVTLDGYIYACGSYKLISCERYNIINNQWVPISSMSRCRYRAGAAVLSGRIFIAGGESEKIVSKSVEVYDPSRDWWMEVTPTLNVERSKLDMTALGDRIYVVGGHNDEKTAKNVEAYDSESDSWSVIGELDERRVLHRAITCFFTDKQLERLKQTADVKAEST